jgi:hypothetical protein
MLGVIWIPVFLFLFEYEYPEASIGLKEYNQRGMTFVSVPKSPGSWEGCMRLRLVIGSWLSSDPDAQVVLFADRRHICRRMGLAGNLDELYGKGRVIYAGPGRRDRDGVPFVHSWFKDGAKLTYTKYVSLINSDIVLSSRWNPEITTMLDSLNSSWRPFVLSVRSDVDFPIWGFNQVRFAPNHMMHDIDRVMVVLNASKHAMGGIDIFTFNRDDPPFELEGIPHFLMGKLHWDVWLVKMANECCDPIYTKFDPPIYHLNHHAKPHNYFERKARRNTALALKAGGWENVWNSKWYLNEGKLCYNEDKRTGHFE